MLTEKLHQQIEEYCKTNKISGMLRITIQDEVVYRQNMGFADWEKQLPFVEESMFTLYSLSKPFCAIGLLKLKDAGLVELDVHPAKYVPEALGLMSVSQSGICSIISAACRILSRTGTLGKNMRRDIKSTPGNI